jgi:hypothetical protein
MRRGLLVLGVALGFSTVGCSIFGPDQSIVLGVTEIDAPATIAPGASLSVTFLVALTDGCKKFDRFEIDRVATGANVTVWGTDAGKGKSGGCPQVYTEEPRTIAFNPPFGSTFTISVNQGAISETVEVR